MPSYFSSWSMGPAGFVSAGVKVTGVGRGLPLLISEIEAIRKFQWMADYWDHCWE